jgi:hypothetical protein
MSAGKAVVIPDNLRGLCWTIKAAALAVGSAENPKRLAQYAAGFIVHLSLSALQRISIADISRFLRYTWCAGALPGPATAS